MSKVSVIMPVYNAETFLSRSIESVLNQTFSDFELLLIDDGSTDGSGKLCDSYAAKDPRVRVYHLDNAGVSRARNFGLHKSAGGGITFIDSDDSVEQDWLETLYNGMTGDNIVLSVCGYKVIDETGGVISERKLNETAFFKREEFLFLSQNALMGTVWNKMFRKEVIDENNLWFKDDLNYREDELFVLQYIQTMKPSDKIFVSTSLQYLYRKGIEGSLTKRYIPNFFQIGTQLNQKFFDICVEFACDQKLCDEILSRDSMYLLDLSINNILSEKNFNGIIKKFIQLRKIVRSTEYREIVQQDRCMKIYSTVYTKILRSRSAGIIMSYLMLGKLKGRRK
ncbi:glycosyltransferase family 2 protein [Murimonas intestini]|nr:glycosyltransferase family 2 protein [Murimonas intestini]